MPSTGLPGCLGSSLEDLSPGTRVRRRFLLNGMPLSSKGKRTSSFEDAETGRGGDAERTGDSGSVKTAHRARAASRGEEGLGVGFMGEAWWSAGSVVREVQQTRVRPRSFATFLRGHIGRPRGIRGRRSSG